jgi:hypothetical protein
MIDVIAPSINSVDCRWIRCRDVFEDEPGVGRFSNVLPGMLCTRRSIDADSPSAYRLFKHWNWIDFDLSKC